MVAVAIVASLYLCLYSVSACMKCIVHTPSVCIVTLLQLFGLLLNLLCMHTSCYVRIIYS